jgi:hypothetical protein
MTDTLQVTTDLVVRRSPGYTRTLKDPFCCMEAIRGHVRDRANTVYLNAKKYDVKNMVRCNKKGNGK